VGYERRSPQAQKPKRLHLRPDTYGKRSSHPRTSVGAMFGLAGIITLFIGAALNIAAWLAGGWWAGAWIQGIGIALLALTVPLLAYGAHCFDCVERESRAAKRTTTASKGKD
jgi:membrane protein implicated in regulation of membrane protease activity